MELELTTCPECGRTAEIIDRFTLPSTDGMVEHVKTRCITGRWFVIPSADLPEPAQPEPARARRAQAA